MICELCKWNKTGKDLFLCIVFLVLKSTPTHFWSRNSKKLWKIFMSQVFTAFYYTKHIKSNLCCIYMYHSPRRQKQKFGQRCFLLIEQRPGPSSRCYRTSCFLRLELQRAGDSPHYKWKFSWRWIRATAHRINTEESSHRSILRPIVKPQIVKGEILA